MPSTVVAIKFFASLREQIGEQDLELSIDAPAKISKIVEILCQNYPERNMSLLKDESFLVALNQTMTNREQVVQVGDELAFFPPVTGG